jgi:hypothetical protein
VRTVLGPQLKVVQANRRVLAGKESSAADRAAHNRLLRAAAVHERSAARACTGWPGRTIVIERR